MNIAMPEKVKDIITTLQENGHEAYIVGGCVRDVILGREPGDWDITTSALPVCVKELFRRTIDTGIEHGTVTVMMGKEGFEVTTYRIDGEYADGRHPDSVEFTSNLVEDLKRRDFTINALAYNDESGMVDEFGGLSDMENKLIKCVGNPIDRFTEDALRMMRAIRFSAQLSFAIEEKTFDAIKELNVNISKVSKERIQVELTKTLNSKHPEYIEYYYTSGLSKYIFPIIDKHKEYGNFERVSKMLNFVEAKTDLRYAVLFFESGEQNALVAMKDLKFDNDTIRTVSKIAKYADMELIDTPVSIRHYLNIMDVELFEKLLLCKCAYAEALGEDTDIYRGIFKTMREVLEAGDAYKISQLAINGKTLISMGIGQGKQIGEILEYLLERVMEEPSLNEETVLVKMVKERYGA